MGRMEEVHPKGFPFISFFLTSFDSLPAQKLSVTGSRIISLHLNHETPLVLIGNLPLKTAPAAFGPLCASTKQIPEKFKSSHPARLLFSPKSRFACECELWFLLKPGLATAHHFGLRISLGAKCHRAPHTEGLEGENDLQKIIQQPQTRP